MAYPDEYPTCHVCGARVGLVAGRWRCWDPPYGHGCGQRYEHVLSPLLLAARGAAEVVDGTGRPLTADLVAEHLRPEMPATGAVIVVRGWFVVGPPDLRLQAVAA